MMRSARDTFERAAAVAGQAPAGGQILDECMRVAGLLLQKNIAYGNSALQPARIFSKADSVEQIKVRIDDKLSRLMNGSSFAGDNDIDDLIGYLVLLKVAMKNA